MSEKLKQLFSDKILPIAIGVTIMATFYYVRVSTKEQNENRQLDLIGNTPVDRMFIDKASGKNFQRKEYETMKSVLRNGDLLIVASLDRFGRNYTEIEKQWREIVAMGVDIQVLDLPILNTRNNENGLTSKLITDIFLKLIAYLAEKEYENIHTRQKQGIMAAKLRGNVKFGRPKRTKLPDKFLRAYDLYSRKEINLSEALAISSMPKSTFYDYVKLKKAA